MSITINFLEASVPLTKRYELNRQNELTQSAYPNVLEFKSHEVTCTSLQQFSAQLTVHAKHGHCLLKGRLNKTLNWESRKGSTTGNATSNWMCFDLDGAPFSNPEEFMNEHKLLNDVSYVVQYSASHGLGKPGLRCHIFIELGAQYNVSYLKSWLMELNLDGNLWGGKVRRSITLSNSGASLHWPIDITACQNDKLLYIAPATIGKGVKYALSQPIQYIAKKTTNLNTSLLATQNIEQWKKEQRVLLNSLRREAGLDPLRVTRMIDKVEVQGRPGEAVITGIKEDRGFVYFNLNGGDSWGYYHPEGSFEYIYNFKGEPTYLTCELLPEYYKDCVNRRQAASQQPTSKGEVILGVCDKRTAAYWKISWNPTTIVLQLHPAKNKDQLIDWYAQHGKTPGEFVPQWNFDFNPQNNVILDLDKQYLNTYVPSTFYRDFKKPATLPGPTSWPTIRKIIASAVSCNEWNEVTEHFLNWCAVLFQHRIKIGTTWLLSGIEGTGKNLLSNHIMRPLLGSNHVKEIGIEGLEEKYNGWLEHCLLCFVNEIQVNSSQHKNIIAGKLRNWITDSPLGIRNMQQTNYDADNFCNFVMNSNVRAQAVDITDNDRRYNICEYQETKLVITNKEIATIPKELPAFFTYLMTREANLENARKIIKTKARQDTIESSRNSVDMLADAILAGDLSPFVETLPDVKLLINMGGTDNNEALAYDVIIRRELQGLIDAKPYKPTASAKEISNLLSSQTYIPGQKVYESRLSRAELFVIFNYCIGNMPDSPNKFTRMLKYKRLETKRMQSHDGEITYGIKVTWVATPEWCAENTLTPTKPVMRRVK